MSAASRWIIFVIGVILFANFAIYFPMFITSPVNGHPTLSLRLDLPWLNLLIVPVIMGLAVAAVWMSTARDGKSE